MKGNLRHIPSARTRFTQQLSPVQVEEGSSFSDWLVNGSGSRSLLRLFSRSHPHTHTRTPVEYVWAQGHTADQTEWLRSLLCSVPMKTAVSRQPSVVAADPGDEASCMYISAGLGFLWRARPLTSWLRTARVDLFDAIFFCFVLWHMFMEWAFCPHEQHLHVHVWEPCALLWVKQVAGVAVFLRRSNAFYLWHLVNGIGWHYFSCQPTKNIITFTLRWRHWSDRRTMTEFLLQPTPGLIYHVSNIHAVSVKPNIKDLVTTRFVAAAQSSTFSHPRSCEPDVAEK